MRMYDIIEKKKHGEELSSEEIYELIGQYTKGNIPDYQMSAFLMAVYFKGMSDNEISVLTDAMATSGDTVNLEAFGSLSVDKHSTGGVGDKTTLIVTPIVSAAGGIVAKMSGRGLGHTGGTVDKLESFPGFRTALSPEQFKAQVEKCRLAVIGQSANLAPADKMLYALRDVTATVDSIPLIASSIMSKKLAAGTRSIVLDVKCGSGAFMNTAEKANELATAMVKIGKSRGRNTAALITNMDIPLGHAVGNALEVKEAISVLKGEGPDDLREVCLALASLMLELSLGLEKDKAESLALETLKSGKAYAQFLKWIKIQGGDVTYATDTSKFGESKFSHSVISKNSGYVLSCNAEMIGIAAMKLGAGRETKDDLIDFKAGIMLHKKPGDKIQEGDVIATLYTDKGEAVASAEELVLSALTFSSEAPERQVMIYGSVR
ncbi:MAG: thymidine phosphorylase [Ruminococcaceae bacterium]|nr:thymidine phosphorylase [Oscillospiraceae bacterium]